jgi:hypothetical protein
MIKWLKKKIHNWASEDWENASKVEEDCSTSVRSRRFDQQGMNFTIYSANGGYVMEYASYDRRTEERTASLHIIPSDQDLGQSIAYIITLEMLRK